MIDVKHVLKWLDRMVDNSRRGDYCLCLVGWFLGMSFDLFYGYVLLYSLFLAIKF